VTLAGLLSAVVSANVLAFMQARAMTRFVESGERTRRPDELNVLEKIGVVLTGVVLPRPRASTTPAKYGLEFQVHRFASSAGVNLEAWYVPGKENLPLVLLFHGYAISKSSLLTTMRVFHELGYAMLLVDFYGSGGSTGSGTTVGVKEADDVAAAVDHARRTWPGRKIVLYGISMGGAAVLRAVAVNGVKPDGVIIEATFDTLLNAARNRFHAMGLPGSPFAELLLFWGSVQQNFNFFSHRPVDYARVVVCPALILHGEWDALASAVGARGIAKAIGKDAQFVGYAGVRHMPIVEARPDDWKREVRVFLEQAFSDISPAKAQRR
jgi:alpha-beta hydrolase superfamily lysophospholipase